jgi:hypothetical protein
MNGWTGLTSDTSNGPSLERLGISSFRTIRLSLPYARAAEPAGSAMCSGQLRDRNKFGSNHGVDHQLGDSIAGFNLKRVVTICIEHDDTNLSAVTGINGAG